MIVISVRDSKAGVYGPLGLARTLGSAERDFKTLVNTPDTLPNKNPEDFDLYEMGSYDDESGKITALDTPRHIVKAIQVRAEA